MPGTGSPSFWRAAFSPASPPCFWEPHFWAVLAALSRLLFVLAVLAAFWLKGKLHRMDGDGWEAYFQSVSTLRLLLGLGGTHLLSLLLTAWAGVPLFSALGFPLPERLALVYLAAGVLKLLHKLSQGRDELLRQLIRLKPGR